MNILIVGTKSLFPVTMGNQRWISEFILQLKNLGHSVYYLYVHNPQYRNYSKETEKHTLNEAAKQKVADKQFIYKVKFLPSLKVSGYSLLNRALRKGFGHPDNMYPLGLARFAKKIIREYKIDACVVNYYYLSKLLTKINVPIKALVTHDSFIYRNIRTKTNTHSLTPNMESKALRRANHILSLQLNESALFEVLAPESEVSTIFMPLKYHPNPATGNHNILYFAGNGEYNIKGIKWFVTNVLPLLTEKFEDTKLVIGGGICKSLDYLSSNPNIQLYGFVDSPEEFFKLGDISINPVYQGSGLKIKTIESISYDKVTIVNPHSAAGLLRTEKTPFIEVSTPIEWRDTIISYWEDPNKIEQFKKYDKDYCEAINHHIKKELNRVFE